MNERPTITIHMVSSLDGFVANTSNDPSWMQSSDTYDKGITLSAEKIADFLSTIDCYVMGSRTYETALKLGWPYGEKPVVVLTSRKLNPIKTSVSFYQGSLIDLVRRLKKKYQNIWMVGGSALAKDFLQQKLVDEIVVSIMPVLLGDGILFFNYIQQEQTLHLKDVTAYKDGMVELSYKIL